MADVFISYARADWDHAKQLADQLTTRGYQVWWDVELVGSDNFRDVIMSELETAKAVIVIWSAASCCSNFVLDEAGRALRAGKLVATRLDNFDPQNLPLGFGTQHTDLVAQLKRITPALDKLGIDTTAQKSAAEQARLLSETAFWNEIKDSDDIQDFNLYLNEYPDGLHRASAKLRLQKLGTKQPEKTEIAKKTISTRTIADTKKTTSTIKTSSKHPLRRSSMLYEALACLFVLLAIPAQLFLTFSFNANFTFGYLMAAGLIILLAIFIIWLRRRALGNVERAIYLLGTTNAIIDPFNFLSMEYLQIALNMTPLFSKLFSVGLIGSICVYLWLRPLRK